jgi:hypothetical protein
MMLLELLQPWFPLTHLCLHIHGFAKSFYIYHNKISREFLTTYNIWHLGAFKFREQPLSKIIETNEWHVSLYYNYVAWYITLISTILNPPPKISTTLPKCFAPQLQIGM